MLSNSLGTDSGLWHAQADALAQSRSVWRYDTRGHGQSDAPEAESDSIALARNCSPSSMPAVPAGRHLRHLDGGMTALWAAVHAPHRVRRVILANTAARIGNDAMWAERIRGAKTDGMGVLADASMARWFTEGFASGILMPWHACARL